MKLFGRKRNVALYDVLGTLTDAIQKLSVALFDKLFLGFVTQLIYSLKQWKVLPGSVAHLEMMPVVVLVVFYC